MNQDDELKIGESQGHISPAEFEHLLLEGLDSGSAEMNTADWEKLRERARNRYASRTHID